VSIQASDLTEKDNITAQYHMHKCT